MSSHVTKSLLERENQDTFAVDDDPREKREKKNNKKPFKEPKKPRDRSNSRYSIISLSEVTEGALQIWRTLPEKIRQDPSLASFRQENERLHGKLKSFL